jgi:hypothetical protein
MIILDKIDAAPISHDEFSFVFSSWFAVLVDSLNESLNLIENQLNGISNGLIPPSFTTAQINAFAFPANLNDINSYMPNGTIWFDSTIAKLKVQTAIVLGVGATIETITSV